LGYPIAEIDAGGSCVITKHDNLKGFVNLDTVRSQLLYELQGNIYLNSDVKADIEDIRMSQIGKNRIHVSGVHGHPPPSTTKLAIFYQGGYQAEFFLGATGTPKLVEAKWRLLEAQIRWALMGRGVLDTFDVLEFQHLGVPEPGPRTQQRGTAMCRVFVQAIEEDTVRQAFQAYAEMSMQHFHGISHSPVQSRSILIKFQACIPPWTTEPQSQYHIWRSIPRHCHKSTFERAR
jgi:hypothetical protein